MTRKFYKKCFACCKECEFGLKLNFELQEDESVLSNIFSSTKF